MSYLIVLLLRNNKVGFYNKLDLVFGRACTVTKVVPSTFKSVSHPV